jgi:hypothetical protein
VKCYLVASRLPVGNSLKCAAIPARSSLESRFIEGAAGFHVERHVVRRTTQQPNQRNPIYGLKILLSSYCAADLCNFELSAIPDSRGIPLSVVTALRANRRFSLSHIGPAPNSTHGLIPQNDTVEQTFS